MSGGPFSLEGKTILVTGAWSGIGRQTCITASGLGARMTRMFGSTRAMSPSSTGFLLKSEVEITVTSHPSRCSSREKFMDRWEPAAARGGK